MLHRNLPYRDIVKVYVVKLHPLELQYMLYHHHDVCDHESVKLSFFDRVEVSHGEICSRFVRHVTRQEGNKKVFGLMRAQIFVRQFVGDC